ncbi:MAG: site-specific integrase [Chitinophagaceae bacterium]
MEKKNSFSLLSFIRKGKYSKNGQVSVYLRISVDGRRTEISTKTIIPKGKWLSGKGRLAVSSEEVRRLNDGIISFEHRAREVYNRFIEQGKIITAESIKNELLGTDHKQHMLVDLFQLTVRDMEKRVNCGFAPGTVKNWRVTEGHLQEFLRVQYKLVDIAFKQLNASFITDFDWFARTHWACGNNASLKHIERIRKVVKRALVNDWLIKDPFLGFDCKQTKSNRTFLTREELEAIQEKPFSVERLDRVRDVFIFCCFTGLAHVDVEKLTRDNIVHGIDGKKWVYTFRQKTGGLMQQNVWRIKLALLHKK